MPDQRLRQPEDPLEGELILEANGWRDGANDREVITTLDTYPELDRPGFDLRG